MPHSAGSWGTWWVWHGQDLSGSGGGGWSGAPASYGGPVEVHTGVVRNGGGHGHGSPLVVNNVHRRGCHSHSLNSHSCDRAS